MRTFEVFNTPNFHLTQDIDLCALATQLTTDYNCSTLSQSDYYKFTLESSNSQLASESIIGVADSRTEPETGFYQTQGQNGVFTTSSHHLGEWQVYIDTCKTNTNDKNDCSSNLDEPSFSFKVVNPCTEIALNWAESGSAQDPDTIYTSRDTFRETIALRSIFSVTPTETYVAAAHVAAAANYCEPQLDLRLLTYTSDDVGQFDFSTYFDLKAASMATDGSVLSQTDIINLESQFKVSNPTAIHLSEDSAAIHPASMLMVQPWDTPQGQYEVEFMLTVPYPTDDDPDNSLVVKRLRTCIKVQSETTSFGCSIPDSRREDSMPHDPSDDYDASSRRLLSAHLTIPDRLDMIGYNTYVDNCVNTNGSNVMTCGAWGCLGSQQFSCGSFSGSTCGTHLNQWCCDNFNSVGYCCSCGGGYTDVISAETEWYAPEKFYTLSKIQMWKNESAISGFKVFFEPETEAMATAYPLQSPLLDGLTTIEHMFGNTDISDSYEELIIPKPLAQIDLVDAICLEFKDRNNGDGTMLTGITLANRRAWEGSCVLTDLSNTSIKEWRIDVPNKGTPHHRLYQLYSRLVGFKMTTGINESGQTYIRQLAPIVDESSCEVLIYLHNMQFSAYMFNQFLGAPAITKTRSVGIYTWFDPIASCQDQLSYVIETDPPAPSVITITKEQSTNVSISTDYITTVQTDDEDFLGEYLYVLKVLPVPGTHFAQLMQLTGIEYFTLTNDNSIHIRCDTDLEAGFPWATPARETRCSDLDWGTYNYSTMPNGNAISAWNPCVPTGDGACSGECDEVPCDEIDLLCYRGWPFDSSQVACRDENGYNKDFNYDVHNFNTNREGSTYSSNVCDPYGQGGKFTSARNPTPEICSQKTMYLPTCVDQVVTFDIAYIATLAIGESISDGWWIKVSSSGTLFDNVFKDGEFGLKTTDAKRLLNKPNSSGAGIETTYSNGISFEDGVLTIPIEDQDIEEQTITFSYPCNEGGDWDAACSGSSYTVTFMIHDVCNDYGLSFDIVEHYADVTDLISTAHHINLCELTSITHEYFWQVTNAQKVFLGANLDKGNVCDYSTAFVDVEITLTSYTNQTGDVLDLSQNEVPLSEYRAFGFSESMYNDLLPTMFGLEEDGTISAQVALYDENNEIFTAVPIGVYTVELALKAIGTRAGHCFEVNGKLYEQLGSQWNGDECEDITTSDCGCGICQDCDFDRGAYTVELFREKLDLYVCEDCTQYPDWEANRLAMEEAWAAAEAARLAALEGWLDLSTLDGLFTSAKNILNEEYPMIMFVTGGESKEVSITVAVDPLYEEMSFVENFGQASKFATFDRESGEILIEPSESMIGEYVLRLEIILESLAYEKTMYLSVQSPLTEDSTEDDTASMPVTTTENQELFIMPETSPIEVLIDEDFTFVVSQYITAGIGTTVDKVELMQLSDFSTYDQTSHVIKVMPAQLAQAGDYPFIVRVFDSQNRPQSQQFSIKVMIPGATDESEETQEVEEEHTEEEQATQETVEIDPGCDEECQYENALQNVVEEVSLNIGGVQIEVELGELTSNEDAILELFESGIADLSTEEQQGVFGDILVANAEYKQQQRQLEELEARANGWTIPTPEPPSLAFQNIESSGKFGIFFDADIAGLQFLEKLNKGLASAGSVTSSNYRRLQEEDNGGFELSNYIKFEIQSGGEDSALPENLAFTVVSAGLENSLLMFQLEFENPLFVSIGSNKDKMIATIVDGSFFSSSGNGLQIESGYTLEQLLPKMLPGDEIENMLQTAQTSVETATNTFVVGQIIITMVLAISLKSMWNLMNVIQVLSYIRFFTRWPATLMQIFKFMDDAITLKPVSDPIFEYGQSQFDKANATLSDEGMRNAGVQDTKLLKSLGLFGVIVIGLLISVAFYFLIKGLDKKHAIVAKIKAKLEKKLFYSSFLRYMIVSNLKLNYTVWAFLIGSWSFATLSSSLMTGAYIFVICGLCIYPVFLMWFMVKNQHQLNEPKMARKFDTLYQGIYTNNMQALMYNTVFCVRRFLFVLINVIFSPGFPLVNFESNHYLFKNLCFILVQTIYLGYVWDTRPHTNNIFNKLEMFNEGMIVVLCYIMVAYTGIGPTEYIIGATTPIYMSIGITVIIVCANFGVMFKLTFNKIKEKWAKRQEMKRQKAMQKYQEQQYDEEGTATKKKESASGRLESIEEESDLRLESYDAQEIEELPVARLPVARPVVKTLTHARSLLTETSSEEEEGKEVMPMSIAQQRANMQWQRLMDNQLYGIGRDPNAPPEPEMTAYEVKMYKRLLKELMRPDDVENIVVEHNGYTFDFRH